VNLVPDLVGGLRGPELFHPPRPLWHVDENVVALAQVEDEAVLLVHGVGRHVDLPHFDVSLALDLPGARFTNY
jgi:hypothetical protein